MDKISVVVNTFNEEKNIKRALASVLWADEIIVCDMHSDDKTVEIAKKMGAKIFYHKKTEYVEPARNFAISKASNDWELILDADEEIPEKLVSRLQRMATDASTSFVEIPRKNIIFGHFMKASMWWPDYHIRFFKKGSVVWNTKIHSKPQTSGTGSKLEAEEELAIIHFNYQTVFQYVNRLNRYTDIEARDLQSAGIKFHWVDVVEKPLREFLSRFFANRGFDDGLHGLALSFLQSFSFLVVYLKLWELQKFTEEEIDPEKLNQVFRKSGKEICYWLKLIDLSQDPIKRFFQKVTNRL